MNLSVFLESQLSEDYINNQPGSDKAAAPVTEGFENLISESDLEDRIAELLKRGSEFRFDNGILSMRYVSFSGTIKFSTKTIKKLADMGVTEIHIPSSSNLGPYMYELPADGPIKKWFIEDTWVAIYSKSDKMHLDGWEVTANSLWFVPEKDGSNCDYQFNNCLFTCTGNIKRQYRMITKQGLFCLEGNTNPNPFGNSKIVAGELFMTMPDDFPGIQIIDDIRAEITGGAEKINEDIVKFLNIPPSFKGLQAVRFGRDIIDTREDGYLFAAANKSLVKKPEWYSKWNDVKPVQDARGWWVAPGVFQ